MSELSFVRLTWTPPDENFWIHAWDCKGVQESMMGAHAYVSLLLDTSSLIPQVKKSLPA